jgi:hypothetical protein
LTDRFTFFYIGAAGISPTPLILAWKVTQGDQIGRIFASWAINFFGRFLKISEVAQNYGLLFPKVSVLCLFGQKTG